MTLRTCRFRLALAVAAGWSAAACVERDVNAEGQEREWTLARAAMVRQIRAYGVKDEGVLAAMGKVRRHVFIPDDYRHQTAYGDHPNPIGHDQTISQPFIVAYMTERLNLKRGEKVLEIGTGSGYQAAVLAELGANVFSIEIVAPLAEHARRALTAEGYTNKVHVLTGDGYQGWPEHAPFDAVIVTCAPEEVPPALVQQLADGGRMILPLGVGLQRLVVLRKKDGVIRQEEDLAVRFVPMVHGAPRAVNAKEQ
jgi:protein-L-isoaspartate(D-aspartate) O-methyltransferase